MLHNGQWRQFFNGGFLKPCLPHLRLGFRLCFGCLEHQAFVLSLLLGHQGLPGVEKQKRNCDAKEWMNIKDNTSKYTQYGSTVDDPIKQPAICIDLQCLAAGEGNVAPNCWDPMISDALEPSCHASYPNVLCSLQHVCLSPCY